VIDMATRANIEADLTLEIDGHSVTPDKFMRGVRAFFGLVREVTHDFVGPQEFVHWVVQVKSGSNLIGLSPHQFNILPTALDAIYARIEDGIEIIENEAKEPEGFPEAALQYVRDLASVVGTDESDDTKVRIWTKKRPVSVTHKTVAHVATLLREQYEDFGTIEGRIHVISDQGALHVFVTEPVWNRRIRCYFDEEMLPLFLAAFRKRVEVTGRIKYRRDGRPISIHATALSEFPDAKNLPSYRDMRGIFREQV
jgi:hypothetical protein